MIPSECLVGPKPKQVALLKAGVEYPAWRIMLYYRASPHSQAEVERISLLIKSSRDRVVTKVGSEYVVTVV